MDVLFTMLYVLAGWAAAIGGFCGLTCFTHPDAFDLRYLAHKVGCIILVLIGFFVLVVH